LSVGVVRAAGGLLVRPDPSGLVRVAIVHRPRYDDWSFPKGKADDGEPDEDTALREVQEETGFRAELEAELPTIRYLDRLGRPKVVRYWVMHPEDGAFVAGDEVDELRWTTFGGAETLLTYDHDRALIRALRRLLPPGQPVYLVRHGKAGDRARWTEDDRLRPLTRKGRRQAEALVDAFRDRVVERIVTSPFVRCVQTVRPLALERRLGLENDEALAEAAPVQTALDLLARVADAPTVLCSHGDVIPALVEQLAANGARVVTDRDWKKGSTWVLERGADGEVARMSYEAPPPL
jgi:phosphohistidine phosphatase SixA/8-oxo-dGTP pyrophosphatase MutT (NUDIX family)